MSNHLDTLPAELRIEVFNRCDYPSKIVFYEFLLHQSYPKAEAPGNRYFNNSEIVDLIKYDNPELIEYYIHKKPDKSYIDKYIKSLDTVYTIAISLECLKIIRSLVKNFDRYSEGCLDELKPETKSDIMNMMIVNERVSEVGELYQKGVAPNSDIFLRIAERDNLELFKKLRGVNLKIKEPLVLSTYGSLDIDKRLLHDKNFVNTCIIRKNLEDIYSAAAANGNIEFLEYLWTIQPLKKSECLAPAVRGKHINVIDWSISKLIPFCSKYSLEAAKTGDPELLKQLENRGCPWDSCIIYSAAESGNILMYEYVRSNWHRHYDEPQIFDVGKLSKAVVSSNSSDMIEYVNLREYSSDCLYYPLINDNFELFKFVLKRINKDLDYSIMEIIVTRRRYLEYILESVSDDTLELIKRSVMYSFILGYLDTFIYLLEVYKNKTGNNLDLKVVNIHLTLAVQGIHYHIIEYCVNRGITIYPNIIDGIIKSNNINMVKFLKEKKVTFDDSNLEVCTLHDNLEMFQVLQDLFYPKIIETCVTHGALKILKYIHEHLYKVNMYPNGSEILTNRTRRNNTNGNEDVLKWLISIGCSHSPYTNDPVITLINYLCHRGENH